jgi:hypothetical protein
LADVKSAALRAANPPCPAPSNWLVGRKPQLSAGETQWPAMATRRSFDPHGLGPDHEVAIRDRVIFSLDEFDDQVPTQ